MKEHGIVRKFLIYTLAAFLITTVVLGMTVVKFIEKQHLGDIVEVAAITARIVLESDLKDYDFKTPFTSAQSEILKEKLGVLSDITNVLDIRIWNPEGVILYDRDPTIIGKRFSDNPELVESLENQTIFEITKPVKMETKAVQKDNLEVMEIYIPIVIDSQVMGVFEVYESFDEARKEIEQMNLIMLSVMSMGLGILYIFLLRIVYNASTSLIEMNKALSSEVLLKEQAREDTEKMAFFDQLTGLPNRVLLENRLEQSIDLAARINKPLGILYMDLDDFNSVNDTMGHERGDELLKSVSERLMGLVRKSDTVARMGGDEFVLLVQNLENADYISAISYKILNAFKEPFVLNDNEIFMSTSIGTSIYPIDGLTKNELIKHADLAMYQAKKNGKNRYVACDESMKIIVNERMKLSNGLYRALERNELEVYYQPQVCHRNQRIVGFEALLRWNHPELGLVGPSRFIDLAEQTGLIIPIGEWVLRTVCRQNKAWIDAGLPPLRVAVNLSIIQFQSPNLVKTIKDIVAESELPAEYLELEVTESIAMRDKDFVIGVLEELKKEGFYISIDDFGTDYSSLAYLKQLPVDRIKIPMPFVHGISQDVKDEAIIKAIIVLSQSMGMDVIAEGVETMEQANFLMQQQCEDMQGFLHHKPMPASEIESLLSKRDLQG